MPKRKDIHKILIIGSGPIVIGQACEFDYSGTQACKVLRKEGYKVVLVNSNPATIMTDPEVADRTYIEPITPEIVEKVIRRERPDSLLPTLGGQTGLNTAVALAESGVLKKYGVRLLGANLRAIKKAEERDLFKKTILDIGLGVPRSGCAHTWEEAKKIVEITGFPAIIRPSYTLGGTGGNVAYNAEEYDKYVHWGLSLSPKSEVLIEESVIGWKEYELEVMRDRKDNVVIVCSIENLDPMGIHTGDSVTVAPAQTLTDKEYQIMRDAALKIIRAIGVETGGSNIQFAVHPETGKLYVIEMNPRVSRSSALASKATGFPIAKIASLLAVGYTLDEIPNDITKKTPACFEPTIDYCVVKWPRFTFEKFPQTPAELTIQMKSVGEAMAIGRTFKEAMQKAIRSLEIDRYALDDRRVDKSWPYRATSSSPLAGEGGAVVGFSSSAAACVGATRTPVLTFWTPSTTILSPVFNPLSITHREPTRSAGVTGRSSTALSLPTSRDEELPLHLRHRALRDQQRPLLRLHGRPDGSVLAGAQQVTGVGEERPDPHRAGLHVHLPVRQGDLPLVGVDGAVGEDQFERYGLRCLFPRLLPLPPPELHVLLFADRDVRLDGVYRRHGGQFLDLSRPHQVPDLGLRDAGDAVHRGCDPREPQVQLRRIQLRLCAFDGRPAREFGADVVVQVLLAHGVLLRQRPDPLQVRLGRFPAGFRLGQGALGGVHGGLEGARVDLEEDLPLSYEFPFPVILLHRGSRSPGPGSSRSPARRWFRPTP